MCVYTRTLPWESVLRVLDMFFCEARFPLTPSVDTVGKIVIFKVGLVLLERCFGSSSYRKSCEGLDDVIMRAQDIPSKLDNPEELVQEVSPAWLRGRDSQEAGQFHPRLLLSLSLSLSLSPDCF
ncbi:unnamed protein product [Schistocephalus solidus]|uniref:Protein kinase domain-containing protein n=1 Tax=Schistocephalus solidus TaxID=70667 RepID=A0A183SXG9_SCHSO|nr:unnamed protein product [Schistocephalus solidus]